MSQQQPNGKFVLGAEGQGVPSSSSFSRGGNVWQQGKSFSSAGGGGRSRGSPPHQGGGGHYYGGTSLKLPIQEFRLEQLETRPTRMMLCGPHRSGKTVIMENIVNHFHQVAKSRGFPFRVVMLSPIQSKRAVLARYVHQNADHHDNMDIDYLTQVLNEQKALTNPPPVLVVISECFAGHNRALRTGSPFDQFVVECVEYNISLLAVSQYEIMIPRKLRDMADYALFPLKHLTNATEEQIELIYRCFFRPMRLFANSEAMRAYFWNTPLDPLTTLIVDTQHNSLFSFKAQPILRPQLPSFLSASASYSTQVQTRDNRSNGPSNSPPSPPIVTLQKVVGVLGTAALKSPAPSTLPTPRFFSSSSSSSSSSPRSRTPSPPLASPSPPGITILRRPSQPPSPTRDDQIEHSSVSPPSDESRISSSAAIDLPSSTLEIVAAC